MEGNYSVKKGAAANMAQGIGLTLLIALAAKYMAELPYLSVLGQLVLAMLLGMLGRMIIKIPDRLHGGTAFSSKKLLRLGIILLGLRLNLADIWNAGPKVLAIAVIHILFTLVVVYKAARWFKADQKLAILMACGTAICGAAAVAAISPQIKADESQTAVGAAAVAVLGTLFTLLYTLLIPVLGLSPRGYGLFAGSTLHEIAHVIAAASPAGKDAVDIAVVVKLTRVALLVPVSICIGIWFQRQEGQKQQGSGRFRLHSLRSVPIPWFIAGFLAMSGVNSLGFLPGFVSAEGVTAAYLLLAMAMAGLGLHVDLGAFKRFGAGFFAAGLMGSVLLSCLGYGLVRMLGLA